MSSRQGLQEVDAFSKVKNALLHNWGAKKKIRKWSVRWKYHLRSILIQNSSTVPKCLFISKILAPTFLSVIRTPMCFNLEKTPSLPLLWGTNLLKHAAQLSGRMSFTSGQNFCSFLNLSLLLKHHLWLKLFWMWFKGGGRSCLLSLYPLKKSSKIYVGKSRKWKPPNCP